MNAVNPQLTLRECVLHGLLLLLIVAGLFPGTFLRGEHAVPGELLYKYEPWSLYKPADAEIPPNELVLEPFTQTFFWYAQVKKTIEGGEWPLWNPMQFCGLPLLANFQSAVFYPPRMLHSVFDFVTATTLFLLLRVWLCGATAYWCGRAMGMGMAGARFLSLGWMLCMYNMVWVYWPVPDTSAWAPVLLLGTERILQSRYRQGFFAIALGGSLILLAGHPETAFTISLGIGAYFLIRLLLEKRWGARLWKPLIVAGFAWAPVLLICAAQLIPFLEYLVNSFTYAQRTGAEDTVPSLLFRGLVAFWVPRFFGANVDGNFWGIKEDATATFAGNAVGNTNHVSYIYVGLITWVVAALALSRVGANKRVRDRCIAFAIPSAVGLLLALEHPMLSFVHEWPLFGSVVRTYYANFLLLSLVVVGAMGVDALARDRLNPRAAVWPLVGISAIAVFVVAMYAAQRASIPDETVRAYVIQKLQLAFTVAALGMSLVYLGVRGKVGAKAAAVLTLLLVVDLFIAARGIRHTSPRAFIYPETALFDYLDDLPGDPRFCLITGKVLPGISQTYGIEVMNGYDAILPERFRRFVVNSVKNRDREYWSKLEPTVGAKYYVYRQGEVDEDTPKFRHLAVVDGFNVVENKTAFDRAFLVGRVEVVPDNDALFQQLADEDFDPATSVLTSEPPPGPLPDSVGNNFGTARVTARTSTHVAIEVDANDSCALVLSDTYFPGWKATIDGAPAEIFPANYAFRGVLIPQGRHVVEFAYQPASFAIGLTVSTLTAVLGVIVAGVVLWRIRRLERRQ